MKKLTYEIVFSLLAIIAVVMSFLDIMGKISIENNMNLLIIDNSILIIFALDYFIRLSISKNKKEFFKKNIPDLIAIIPFNSMFKLFRFAKLFRLTKLSRATKLFRLTRLIGLSGKLYKAFSKFLNTNGLIYALYFTIAMILTGSVCISYAEEMPFWDSIWWAFVTTTTVGYGDISPATPLGRIIAGLLMLVGIGTIGMITGTIATYFLSNRRNISDDKPITNIIKTCSDLTDDEKEEMIKFADYLISKRKAS